MQNKNNKKIIFFLIMEGGSNDVKITNKSKHDQKIYRSIIINMFKFKFRTDLTPLNEIKFFKKKKFRTRYE